MKKVFSLFHRKNMNMEEMTMKELEKAIEQLEKENNKIEKA